MKKVIAMALPILLFACLTVRADWELTSHIRNRIGYGDIEREYAVEQNGNEVLPALSGAKRKYVIDRVIFSVSEGSGELRISETGATPLVIRCETNGTSVVKCNKTLSDSAGVIIDTAFRDPFRHNVRLEYHKE